MSANRLDRNVSKLSGRASAPDLDTQTRMALPARGTIGRRFSCRGLIAE